MMNRVRGGRTHGRFPVWLPALILLAAAAVPSWGAAVESGTPAVPAGGTLREVTVARTPYTTTIGALIEGKIGNYNSFKLNDPFRIVVDIWGVSQGQVPAEMAVDTPQVKAVKLSQQDGKLRILVETPEDRPLPFLVNVEKDRLVLSVGGGEEEKVTSLDRPEESKARAAAKGPAVVGIDLEDLPDASNVVITAAGIKAPKVVRKAGIVTLSFPGAALGKGLGRVIDAKTLEIPVKRISPSVSGEGVRIAVAFDPAAEYKIETGDNAVVVSFPKKGMAEKAEVVARAGGEAPPAPQPIPPAAGEAAAGEAGGGPEGRPWGFLAPGGGPKKYIGQRISMDFKDADIQNVFRIIAEVSNLNIITSDDVKGKVTVRLINVPWDQALDIVLRAKQLGAALEGNVLRIAPLSALRAEEKARLDAAKEVEKLRAQVDAIVETIPVNYGKASDLQAKVKDILSEGGKIQVDDRTNVIIIRDLKKNIEEAKTLVAALDTPTPQVLIEARIVEVDTTFTRELGVQWGGSYASAGKTQVGITGARTSTGTSNVGQTLTNTMPFTTAGNLPDPNFAVNLPAAIGLGAGGGISFGILRDNLRLDLSLSALEASGKGRVISSPKVVTIDNKEAMIEQGTQIPYSTVSASGTNTQFIDATLSLKVTPHITPDGRVVMKLEAKNDSQGEVGATGQPAINKKKATTEVLIGDGETAVIGGILQISRKESEAAVPWLSKIPILGYLFKKDKNDATNRELLIFITPRILKQGPAETKAS